MTSTPLSDSVLRTCSDLSLLTRSELERLVRILREESASPKAKRKAKAKGEL